METSLTTLSSQTGLDSAPRGRSSRQSPVEDGDEGGDGDHGRGEEKK